FGFSPPGYFCFSIEFVALGFPIARPGKARGLNVAALFGRLERRELRRGVHRGWNQREGQAGSSTTSELKGGRHRIRSWPNHRPERVRNCQTNAMAYGESPRGQVHFDIQRVSLIGD